MIFNDGLPHLYLHLKLQSMVILKSDVMSASYRSSPNCETAYQSVSITEHSKHFTELASFSSSHKHLFFLCKCFFLTLTDVTMDYQRASWG